MFEIPQCIPVLLTSLFLALKKLRGRLRKADSRGLPMLRQSPWQSVYKCAFLCEVAMRAPGTGTSVDESLHPPP